MVMTIVCGKHASRIRWWEYQTGEVADEIEEKIRGLRQEV